MKLGEYDEDMATYQVLEGLDAEDYIIVPSDDLVEGLPVIYNDYNSVPDDFNFDDMDMDDFDVSGVEFDDGDFDISGVDYDEDDMDFDIGDYDEDDIGDEDYYDADAEDDEDFDEELEGLNEDGVSGMMSMLNGR